MGEMSSSASGRLGAVLWTGGKDCTLALCRAREAGIDIARLVTFIPETGTFEAHPLGEMSRLAAAAGFPHECINVAPPYREAYIDGLRNLAQKHGIGTIVTGDIDFCEGHPNWIRECAAGLRVDVVTPLWQERRMDLLEEVIRRGIEARISGISSAHIPSEWLGRQIDQDFIRDICEIAGKASIDLCGENGEYHTMVSRIPPAVGSRDRAPKNRA